MRLRSATRTAVDGLATYDVDLALDRVPMMYTPSRERPWHAISSDSPRRVLTAREYAEAFTALPTRLEVFANRERARSTFLLWARQNEHLAEAFPIAYLVQQALWTGDSPASKRTEATW